MASFNSVPNEILLKVFEQMEYWDLKINLPLVCKTWKSLIDSKTKTSLIDQKLFRDEPIRRKPLVQEKPQKGSTKSGEKSGKNEQKKKPKKAEKDVTGGYKWHPAFEVVHYPSLGGSIDQVVFMKWGNVFSRNKEDRKDKEWKLKDTSVAQENAISPAVSKLHFHIEHGTDPIKFDFSKRKTRGKAVTVLDVMQALVDTFDDPLLKIIGVGELGWNGSLELRVFRGIVHLTVPGFDH